MQSNERKFSQKHPFLFGFALILLAVALITGAMAFFHAVVLDRGFETFADEKLGLVKIEGVIMVSEPVVDWIDELAHDDSVKAVVVRINSPGGAVAPSQEIYHALRDLSAKKPVIASMATVAASGGYYSAAGCDAIVANPGTLTGSLGVKAEMADLKGLMDKIGVDYEIIVSGPYKSTGSPFAELTDKQRAYLQRLIDNIHGQFVADVAEARDLPLEKVRELADGRAYTGQQAQIEGLVDELGGLSRAFAMAKERAGISGRVPLREGPPEDEGSLLLRLITKLGFDPAGALDGVTIRLQ